jgi:(2R)-3-sulfolactate dehydrogenase (NADP+)
MVELISAGLTGANFAAEASSFLDAAGPPPGTGQLLIAIDVGAFAANALQRFGALATSITAQPGARLPGARRLAARAKAAREGLVVADELLQEIERTG